MSEPGRRIRWGLIVACTGHCLCLQYSTSCCSLLVFGSLLAVLTWQPLLSLMPAINRARGLTFRIILRVLAHNLPVPRAQAPSGARWSECVVCVCSACVLSVCVRARSRGRTLCVCVCARARSLYVCVRVRCAASTAATASMPSARALDEHNSCPCTCFVRLMGKGERERERQRERESLIGNNVYDGGSCAQSDDRRCICIALVWVGLNPTPN